jgi:hypothetical protein
MATKKREVIVKGCVIPWIAGRFVVNNSLGKEHVWLKV